MIAVPVTDEVTLEISCGIWTVNAERRMHWGKRSELVSAARWAAKIQAIAAHVPHLDLVSVTVEPHQGPNGPLADTGAHEPVIKACIDGLRDAGVLTDDTQAYVTNINSLPPVRVKVRDVGLKIILTPVTTESELTG